MYCPECQKTSLIDVRLVTPKDHYLALLCPACGERFRNPEWRTIAQQEQDAEQQELRSETARAVRACFGSEAKSYPGAGLEVINPRNERNGK